MTALHRLRRPLGIAAGALAAAAVWLLLHNPDVRNTTIGTYQCAAPYDTVLNDADNVPGGEPPTDADEVEAQCVKLGHTRFVQGIVSGGTAAALSAVVVVLVVQPRTRARATPPTTTQRG